MAAETVVRAAKPHLNTTAFASQWQPTGAYVRNTVNAQALSRRCNGMDGWMDHTLWARWIESAKTITKTDRQGTVDNGSAPTYFQFNNKGKNKFIQTNHDDTWGIIMA